MTAVVIPDTVIGLLGDEIKNVVKQVVTDLGDKYSFDYNEASGYLQERYNFAGVITFEEAKVQGKIRKGIDDHPMMIVVKETTRCRARMYHKGVYGQCTKCWKSEHLKLCGIHVSKPELRHGRVDDDRNLENVVNKIKHYI